MNALGHRHKTLHTEEYADQDAARTMHRFLAHRTSIHNTINTQFIK